MTPRASAIEYENHFMLSNWRRKLMTKTNDSKIPTLPPQRDGSSTRRSTPALRMFSLAILTWVAACGDDDPTRIESSGESVHLRAASAFVLIESLGEEFSLDVAAETESGLERPDIELQWSSLGSGVVEHVAGDVFRSVGNGSVVLEAEIAGGQGVSGNGASVPIRVTVSQQPRALSLRPALVDSEAADPSAPVIRLWSLGQAADLGVWTVDANGNAIDQVTTGLTFGTESEAVGHVTDRGRVTAVGHGTTRVRARRGSYLGDVDIVVDATLDLRACAVYTDDGGVRASTQAPGGCAGGSLTFTER